MVSLSRGAGGERRSHRRAVLDARVEVISAVGASEGRVVNISMGGLAARLDLASDRELIELRVELPEGARIETRGEVVWGRDGIIGLRFISLGQRALLALLRVVGRT